MIDLHAFGTLLQRMGYTFFTGVPCSLLKDLINYSMNHFRYVIATNEGEAVAIAAGAHLGGTKACVLMQNSGLANALNPLTSLNECFEIPVLGFIGWRGEPGAEDEPEHTLVGEITGALLKTCRIPYGVLSTEMDEIERQLHAADEHIRKNKPYFFLVRKNTFSEEKLSRGTAPGIARAAHRGETAYGKTAPVRPTRLEVLEVVSGLKGDDTVVLTSTGKTGRELFELQDSPHNFYMIGSMGCVSSIGLGAALVRSDKRVIAIDGDGALLMRMGSLATNGYYRPSNMLHLLLDNNSHDSTGGQDTVSANVDFVEIAHSCGYDKACSTNELGEVEKNISDWKNTPALTFVHVAIRKGSKKNLGRPTVKPHQVKERLMSFLLR